MFELQLDKREEKKKERMVDIFYFLPFCVVYVTLSPPDAQRPQHIHKPLDLFRTLLAARPEPVIYLFLLIYGQLRPSSTAADDADAT